MYNLAFTVLCLTALPLRAEIASQMVDLPAGPLNETLLEIAEQFEVSLFFAEEHVADLKAPDLQGELTLEQALAEAFVNVCLEFEFIRDRLVAITRGCQTIVTDPGVPQLLAGAAPRPDSPLIEEILVRERYVTGSRIKNAEINQSMPIEVIDQTEITLSGYQAVGELLRYVPAVSGNSTSTLISNGGDGTATVTLRGLPASNTLVLLNGRRLNPDGLYGKAVDLNTLPLAMVERVEILKDGVSAIYGSDSIAGVVNIITKREIDGFNLEVYRGGAAQGGLRTNNYTLLAGGALTGAWTAQLGINHYDQSGILSRQRRLSSSSDDRARGGIDKRSSATIPGRIELREGTRILMDGFAGASPDDYREATEEDLFEYRDFTSSIVPSRRTSYFLNTDYDMPGKWRAYVEGLVTSTRAESQLAPVPVFTGFESTDLTVSAANRFNPFSVDIPDVRRRIAELPVRLQANRSQTRRWIAGLAYESGNASFELTLQSNKTEARERHKNVLNAARVQQALGPDCLDGCVPLNLFGPPGSVTDEMLDFVRTGGSVRGTSRMRGALASVDLGLFRLPAGMVEMSAGAEYRSEELDTTPDAIVANRLLIGGGNRGPINGDRNIIESFAEAYLPLVRERPGIGRLDLQIASRWSNYSDFGKTLNPRMLINYEPVKGLVLRGSIARGFRAPTLLQLYGDRFQSFEQLNDPCSLLENVMTKVGCVQQSDPTLTQVLTINGGERRLDPEVSKTKSFGFHWSKVLGRHFVSTSADWYRIEQADVVESSAQFIVNRNADSNDFADRVLRDDNGNITLVQATLQNIGHRDVTGFDLMTNWSTHTENRGVFTIALNATNIIQFEDRFDPTAPNIDKAGTFNDEASGGLGSLPDWKVSLGFSWQAERWQGHYNIYRVSKLEEIVPIVESVRTIDAWTTHNFNLSYLGPSTGWFRLTLGVNNLFNAEPPFSAAAFNDSYDGRTYDITGRYLYLKLDRSF